MQRRDGFTLVEMLVAMALTLFIMVIVTTAFTTGLETFRGLKGLGDLQESLRTASQRIRADLQANHFQAKQRLSDPNFWANGRPTQGFFRIEQIQFDPVNFPGQLAINEGTDLDGVPSFRGVSHRLYFSVHLIGSQQQDHFYANIPDAVVDKTGNVYPAWPNSPFNPGSPNFKRTNFFNQPTDTFYQRSNSYTSQWAEVAYYLVKTGTTGNWEDPNAAGGTSLYSLWRVQRVVVPDNSQLAKVVPLPYDPTNYYQLAQDPYQEMSCQPDYGDNPPQWYYFNSPLDLAQGNRSLGWLAGKQSAGLPPSNAFLEEGTVDTSNTASNPLPYPGYANSTAATGVSPRLPGSSLLLTNVISFQVQVLVSGAADFQDVGIFDTAIPPNPPFIITALQIKLRVWDPATLQTRQITIIQEM